MTTALQMINTAARRTGFLAAGETLSSDDSADALDVLNTMMDAWATNRLMVYQIVQEVFSTAGSTTSYTIGPSGTWNTTRPVRLDDSSFLRISDIDYPLELVTPDVYANVPMKSVTSTIPYLITYNFAYPLATVSLYPTPSEAGSIYLRSWKALQSFAALTTDLALPPGYRRAIEWNLCKELCAEYGRPATGDILRESASSKQGITSVNAPSMIMQNEVGYNRFRGMATNIYQG